MRGSLVQLATLALVASLFASAALAQSSKPSSSSIPNNQSQSLTIVKPEPPRPDPRPTQPTPSGTPRPGDPAGVPLPGGPDPRPVDAAGTPLPDPNPGRGTGGFVPQGVDQGGTVTLSNPGVTPSPLPALPEPLPTTIQDPDTIVAGEILTLSDTMNDALALAQALAARGLTVIRRQALDGFGDIVLSAFRVPAGRDVPGVLDELRQAFPQLWLGPNSLFDPSAGSEQKPRSYSRELIGWTVGSLRCGEGIRVGVVDTGVDLEHPALKGSDVIVRSFLPAGTKAAPSLHGTAVTSVLVGTDGKGGYPGLLPGAKVEMAAVFHASDGDRMRATAERIVLGLNWLMKEGLRVINLSLGGPVDPILSLIIDRAAGAGVVLVAAAGNNGPKGAPAFPAVHKDVVAVTAVDARKKVFSKANRGDYVDFAAPGVDVWVAWADGGGSYQSGTSYAAPFVAAALAITEGEAPSALRSGVEDLGEPGRDPIYGWGLMRGFSCGGADAAVR